MCLWWGGGRLCLQKLASTYSIRSLTSQGAGVTDGVFLDAGKRERYLFAYSSSNCLSASQQAQRNCHLSISRRCHYWRRHQMGLRKFFLMLSTASECSTERPNSSPFPEQMSSNWLVSSAEAGCFRDQKVALLTSARKCAQCAKEVHQIPLSPFETHSKR